jgi:NDP-sugar pyrophosphorylase family protein
MAGGKGVRLGELTRDVPKPLLKLGGQSILEVIVTQLRATGFRRVTLCLSHLGELVRQEFGHGERFGVGIDYCWDREPLGTAAPLLLVERWESPALVMNGDILTTTDFGELVDAHRRSDALVTVAARRQHVPVDFGVLDTTPDGRVVGIREKPRISVDFSSGIYVIDPAARACVPPGLPMDMPELVTEAIGRGYVVRARRLPGAWHDIGTPAGYRHAVHEFRADPARYLRTGMVSTIGGH